MKTKIIFIFYLFTLTSVFPQSISNYQIITNLIDQSLFESTDSTDLDKELSLNIYLPQPLEILKPYITQKMIKYGYKLKSVTSENLQLSYSISEIKVEYGETFGNFFGELKTERTIILKGSYTKIKDGYIFEPKAFNISSIDTIGLNEFQNIENTTIPFTRGVPPSISVYTNLLEPIIVVGTLIATVILLFSVRSK